MLLFTSTFDGTWNDLPLRPAFLPFVEHTARYLAGYREGSSNMAVDSYVDLRAAASVGAAADVVDPDGKHVLSLRQASSAQTFQFDREGFYEIHPANGREELIAVHADRGESDLTAIPPEALTLWRNTGSAGNSERQAAEDAHARRQSLWRYALLAVLLLAITESLMASRYAFFRKEAA